MISGNKKEKNMAIMTAIEQSNSLVNVYGDDKELKFQVNGHLYGYTRDFVTVTYGNEIITYDSNGEKFHVIPNVI